MRVVNAARFTSIDGFSQTYPLQWLHERNALLATQVGREPLSESFGGLNQLWIEGVAARLFVRDVAHVEFLELDNPQPPSFEADEMLFQNRPNAGISPLYREGEAPGTVGARPFKVGEQVGFKGYAYDYDRPVEAVEFSLDQGSTWTRHETPGAVAGCMVWWTFDYTPEEPGVYELLVRAVSTEGRVGPTPARMGFEVA